MPAGPKTTDPGDQEMPEPSESDYSVAWVIHSMVNKRTGDGLNDVWAWCKVYPDGEPGYREVYCTKQDGVTKVDYPDGAKLGAVAFKLWC